MIQSSGRKHSLLNKNIFSKKHKFHKFYFCLKKLSPQNLGNVLLEEKFQNYIEIKSYAANT